MNSLLPPRRKLGWSYPCTECGENFPLEHTGQFLCSKECRKEKRAKRNARIYRRDIDKRKDWYRKYSSELKKKKHHKEQI